MIRPLLLPGIVLAIFLTGIIFIKEEIRAGFAASDLLAEEYTPLELSGREIYKREGCASCHKRNIREHDNEWIRLHLENPRKFIPKSNMPGYFWMKDTEMDALVAYLKKKGADAEFADEKNENIVEHILKVLPSREGVKK